jgi:hypothetical protein
MQPILVLPPDEMSPEDMQRLRDNGICVVEAKHPGELRFIDPPPVGNHDQVTEASLNLTRFVVNNYQSGGSYNAKDLAGYWAHMLINAHATQKQQVERVAPVKKGKQP